MNETILRKYVRNVISEMSDIDVGTGYDSSATGMGPGGPGIFSLMKALGDPIGDVLKTAKTEIKVLGSHIGRNIETVLTYLGGLFVPGMEANYAPIYARHRKNVESIREENKAIYEKTWGALKSSDAALFAFMAAPVAMIGGKMALAAPRKTKEMLSALTGGGSDFVIDEIYKYLHDRVSDAKISALSGTEEDKEEARLSGKKKKESRFLPHSLVLFEKKNNKNAKQKSNNEKNDIENDNQKVDEKLLSKAIKIALKNPEIVKKLNKKQAELSKNILAMQEGTFKETYEKAKTFQHGFKDLEQAEKFIKNSKLPQDKQSQALTDIEQLKKLPPDKIKTALQVMGKGIDEISKRVAMKDVVRMRKEAVEEGGASTDNPFVKLCDSYLSKFKAL